MLVTRASDLTTNIYHLRSSRGQQNREVVYEPDMRISRLPSELNSLPSDIILKGHTVQVQRTRVSYTITVEGCTTYAGVHR